MDDLGMWRKYEIGTMDKALLTSILQLQREFYESWGRWPTADEILKQMQGG